MDPFFAYIDGLGRLDDNDLNMSIDATMALREETKQLADETLKSYTMHKHHKSAYVCRKRDHVSGIKRK